MNNEQGESRTHMLGETVHRDEAGTQHPKCALVTRIFDTPQIEQQNILIH